MNLTLLLDMAAEVLGDRPAVGPRDAAITYAGLRDQAHAVAAAAPVGQPIVLAAESSDSCPALLFGSAYAGVPFCAVNYRLADERLRAVLARTAPATVVTDPATRPRIEGVEGLRLTDADELLTASAGPAGRSDPTGSSVAIRLFTSGTTGEPKSVLLRHRNLFSYIVGSVELASAGPDEAALVSVPPYHIAGLAAIMSNVYVGRRIVYLPQFEPRTWAELAAHEQVTHAMIVPTMLGRVLDVLESDGLRLPRLRHLSYGGGRMPLPTIERAMALLPDVDFVNAYGLTETSSTITLLTPEDHRTAAGHADADVAARLGSVGQALPGVEIEIRDDEGQPVAPGRAGEVWVRGEQVAGEYQERLALDDGGWFPTRDLGRLDAGGYLFLEGRADDVIVRGGENLSPGEIEDVLRQHPSVAEAAVIGMPDHEWGESPAAFVVFEPGQRAESDELQAWVRARLRSSRTPTVLIARPELPYSETGKLLRRVLRDELATVSAPSSPRPPRSSDR